MVRDPLTPILTLVLLLGALPLPAVSDPAELAALTDRGTPLTGSLAGGPGSDWTNFGGNASRNCLSSERGPEGPDLLWSGGRPTLIAWQPVTEGGRVFMVRQPGSPGDDGDSPIVARDLDTGAELWVANLPFNPGEGITWIAGVRDGRVYASRSNTESSSARLYALDAASGAILWVSQDAIAAGLYDGIVFAPDGDPVIGESTSLRRIDSDDGTTVWVSPRQCWNHPACGPAVFGDAVYVNEFGISRFDLATGAFRYATTSPIGFGQTPLMVGTDGTIYVARANNAPGDNFFYAFEDSGTAIVEKWRVPVALAIASEFGNGPDGSVYMLGPGQTIDRLDPATGALLDRSMVIGPDFLLQPRIAIDALGRVFVTNGSFDDGRLFAFDSDLTLRWEAPVPRVNIGGPALGRNGTLVVVAGAGTDVRAYRTTCRDEDADEVCDAEDECPDSTLSPTIVIGSCDSGVPNHLVPGGCTFVDLIDQCRVGATAHGPFVSCVAHLTNDWRRQDLIAGPEKGRIQRCAAHAPLPSSAAISAASPSWPVSPDSRREPLNWADRF